MPVPLTDVAPLRAEAPHGRDAWTIYFLHAMAAEAADARQLLLALERAWFVARAGVAGRRRHSHATAVVALMVNRFWRDLCALRSVGTEVVWREEFRH
jgi:hypothetical protein